MEFYEQCNGYEFHMRENLNSTIHLDQTTADRREVHGDLGRRLRTLYTIVHDCLRSTTEKVTNRLGSYAISS